MSSICGDLASNGFCVRDGCSLQHPKVCDICDGIRFVSARTRTKHYLTEEHLRFTYERGIADPDKCSICPNVVLTNRYNFVSHYRGEPHRRQANTKRVSPCAKLSPTALRRCHPCNRLIQNNSWESHLMGQRHLRNIAKRAIPTSSTDETESAKPGILDLGFVDPDAQAVVFLVEVQLPTGLDSGYVESASLSSVALPAFKVLSYPTELTGTVPGLVRLSFTPSGLAGRIPCKLTFALKSSHSAQPSSVVQNLSLTVGRLALHESMAPVTPYAPSRPKQRSWNNTLSGKKLTFDRKIVFTVALPEYDVPPAIRKALWKKDQHDQEAALNDIIREPLNGPALSKFWSTLLHAEELQVEESVAAFNMSECTLEKEGSMFRLHVPGLAERRPSILLGDKINLFPSHSEGEKFIAFVHQVWETSTFRRMHQAIHLGHQLSHILFPTTFPYRQRLSGVGGFKPLDPRILENLPQRNAINAILGLGEMSPPFIVFGPPGTGKTVVVVEAIRQILSVPGSRILATAPSNFAADVIAERLARFGVDSDTMFRLNALTRQRDKLPAPLKAFSCLEGRGFDVPRISQLLKYRIIVSTCISSSLLFATGAPRGHFDYIFIDEAGYALEPEALVPILTIADDSTRVVLSGDPKQLGPIVHSPCALSFGFGKSFLERLMKTVAYSQTLENPFITKLVQNYRSHPSILEFPNKKFYEGELLAMVENDIANRFVHWNELRGTNFPVIFHAVHGKDEREAKSPSYFNSHEIDLVDKYLNRLLDDPVLDACPEDIGVISPYNAQNKKLRQLEIVKNYAEDLKTGTVEAFQAQERPIIVISTVRSSPDRVKFDVRHSLGFVAHQKRLNVAITRARSLLIIVGDPEVLSSDQVWNELLHYIKSRGGWRGIDFELPALDDEVDDGPAPTSLNENRPVYDYELPIRENA